MSPAGRIWFNVSRLSPFRLNAGKFSGNNINNENWSEPSIVLQGFKALMFFECLFWKTLETKNILIYAFLKYETTNHLDL